MENPLEKTLTNVAQGVSQVPSVVGRTLNKAVNGVKSVFKSKKPNPNAPSTSLNTIPKYFDEQKRQMQEINNLTK